MFGLLLVSLLFLPNKGTTPPKNATNLTETCPENQTYHNCSTICPLTCENWTHPPKICPKICRERCICPSGLLEYKNNCYERDKCPTPPLCNQNETFLYYGFRCATCINYHYVRCPIQNEPGCYCKNGYVYHETTETCVLPKDCPVSFYCKDPNEEYYECGPKCNETCESIFEKQMCSQGCIKGCFCRSGYIRNQTSGECVSMRQCVTENIQG